MKIGEINHHMIPFAKILIPGIINKMLKIKLKICPRIKNKTDKKIDCIMWYFKNGFNDNFAKEPHKNNNQPHNEDT